MEMKLYKYNDLWPECFLKEKKLLENVLAGFEIGNIEHIGATAVMPCDTYGTIDVLVGIDNPADFDTIKAHLGKNGYILIEKKPHKNYAFFVRKQENKGIVCTIRLMVNGSLMYQKFVAFTYYLNDNPENVFKYNDFKTTLVAKCNSNPKIYSKLKRNFINSILEEFCRFE